MRPGQPRGHSNVYAEQAEPHRTAPGRVMVPICGGATPGTVRPLPPLCITREEWLLIGKAAGWDDPAGLPRKA